MSSSAGGGTGGSGADAGTMLEKAKELDQLRKEQDEVVTEINKIHKKILACKPLYPSSC
jgi:SAGA-associated factor 29